MTQTVTFQQAVGQPVIKHFFVLKIEEQPLRIEHRLIKIAQKV